MKDLYSVINPYNGETLQQYSLTSSDELKKKITQLQLNSRCPLSIVKRARILRKLAAIIEKNCQPLAQQITQEMGKTIQESLVEVQRAIITLECNASELESFSSELKSNNHYQEQSPHRWALIDRAPYGIALAITPYNFPINLALHKIAPSFAMGNSTLLKPHPQCYQSSSLLLSYCYQAGMRECDIQLCMPDHTTLGQLISSDQLHIISFTGGRKTAEKISLNAGLKKQIYELGGNDALIVFADSDLEQAASTAVQNRFAVAGQRCNAAKRIFIEQSCYQQFKEKLIALTEKIKMGDPLDHQTQMGPLVSAEHCQQAYQQLTELIQSKASVLTGGEKNQNFISPTLIENISPDHPIILEEIFGPIAPLFSFNSEDELISMVNLSSLTLQCGVFTNDLNRVKRLFQKIDCATLNINEGPSYRCDHLPFGGVKGSGLGREGAPYSFLEYSQTKTLVF